MHVLVTGGSGLVGRYVVDHLARSHEVEVMDLKPPHRTDLHWHRVDLLDFEGVLRCLGGFEAVVHLGGIPHPLSDPPEKVFRINTLGTFHVLEACERVGIVNLVFMSSESTLGFAFSATRMWPDYLPIDERHPLRPQDVYGLSKVVGEKLCSGYTLRTNMRTMCLRAPWIWVPEEKEIELYQKLVSEYSNWYKNLWAYVHVLDVARAVGLALEYQGNPAHDIFYVCAEENWAGKDSKNLVAEFYPETRSIAPGFGGRMSLISGSKAESVLGFRPEYSVADVLGKKAPK